MFESMYLSNHDYVFYFYAVVMYWKLITSHSIFRFKILKKNLWTFNQNIRLISILNKNENFQKSNATLTLILHRTVFTR